MRRCVREALELGWPTGFVVVACVGLGATNWLRLPPLAVLLAALAAVAGAAALGGRAGLALAGVCVSLLGLWWGAVRLDALDRSVLVGRIGEIEDVVVVVTSPPTRTRFAVRAMGDVRRFAGQTMRERVLLELPAGRAPPLGAVLALRARPVAPRGPETGFDERGWLARRGVHIVLHASGTWRVVGRRGGIGGVGDRLRAAVGGALALGTTGERRALVAAVVLGADEGLETPLRDAFKASGLYHLLSD